MPPRLADPGTFVRPCLRQAWADFAVANHLLTAELADSVHGGGPAYDAALSKYQQSFEKAIKALILQFLPERSELVFVHRFLSDARVWGQADIRSLIQKRLQLVSIASSVHLGLENLLPDLKGARYEQGKVVRLRENSEYPYTDAGGTAVAPCDTMKGVYDSRLLGIEKELDALFKGLARLPEFAGVLAELRRSAP